MINLIVCRDNNNGIGKDNKLLYHISEDLKRFKELTTGKNILMGRKTFESLGCKPLPNRKNFIATNNFKKIIDMLESKKIEFDLNSPICSSDTLIEDTINIYINNSKEEIFIIGGQSIYELFLPYTDKIYLTQVDDNSKEADTFFNFDKSKFELIKCESHHDDKNNVDYYFKDYVRIEK